MPLIVVTYKYILWFYQTYAQLPPVFAGQVLEVLSEDSDTLFCQTPEAQPFCMVNIPKCIAGAYERVEESHELR